MATVRRATVKAVDWLKFAERVPPNQKAQFLALKAKNDDIKSKYLSLPESPPAIDFQFYKKRLADPALVDSLEKQYKAVSVAYPADTITADIDNQQKEAAVAAADFIKESKQRVKVLEVEMDRWNNLVPFENMTTDEYYEVFPETKPDRAKNPYWPWKEYTEKA